MSLSIFLDNPTGFFDKDGARWQRDYTLKGRLQSMTDPFGKVTHYTHHDNGLLKEVIDPEGRSTQYHWNSHTELIQITDFEGNQQRLKYNAFGQIVEASCFYKRSERAEHHPISLQCHRPAGQTDRTQ